MPTPSRTQLAGHKAFHYAQSTGRTQLRIDNMDCRVNLDDSEVIVTDVLGHRTLVLIDQTR
jgi:hypothetical protein